MHIYIFFCGTFILKHILSIFIYFLYSETSGAVRKTGGNFKEKLREHGGLDAVFEVTMDCHSDLEV